MPKYIKIRSKALRPNFSSPIFENFDNSEMARANSDGSYYASSTDQSHPVRSLVERLIEGLASKETITLLHGYDHAFSCSGCSQLLFHPVTGPCGYSFCVECTKESARCKHCGVVHEPSSFFKLNVVLNTILEHWYPEEYRMRSMSQEGDRLLKRGSFKSAEAKFTEAIKENPYDIYALTRRAIARKESGDWRNALADVVSARIRREFIPECLKNRGRIGFSKVASEEDNVVQTSRKMFLEVMSLLIQHTSSVSSSTRAEQFFDSPEWCRADWSPSRSGSGDEGRAESPHVPLQHIGSEYDRLGCDPTISELESAFDTIIVGNISNFVAACSEETCAPRKRMKRISEQSKEFDKNDFCCILCTRPFFEPVCTPCGHTFCLDCLERCFDHGSACPMCKTSLKDIYQYQECLLPIDKSTDAIIKKHLPVLCEERTKSRMKEQEKLRERLPVFVCTVAFPGVKCILHVYEPKYRLMIRRATRVHGGSFGITIGSKTNPFHKIGTIISVQNVSFYQDGRSLVTSAGTKRFEVDEYGTCDGYNTAKVKWIVDEEEPEGSEEETERIATEIYNSGKKWFSHQSDRFKEAVTTQLGYFPEFDRTKGENGPSWPWWLLAILPVKDEIKAYVLAKNRLRARLAIIKLILQRIEVHHSECEETAQTS